MKKDYRNIGASTMFIISSFISSGINYATTPIFVRILSQSDFGIVSKYNSIYSIVQVLAILCLDKPGVVSVGMHDYKNNRWKYMSSVLGLIFASTCVVSFFLVLFWNNINYYLGVSKSLLLLMLINCIFCPATTIWLCKARYEFDYKKPFFVVIFTSLFSQLISILAVLYFKNIIADLSTIKIWSASIVNLIVSIIIYVKIIVKGKQIVDTKLWKQLLKFVVFLIPHYLGFTILNGMDQIMISKMIGNNKVGIYSLVGTISHIAMIIWQGISVLFTPFIHKMLESNDDIKIKLFIKPIFIFISICCCCISFLSPELILIVGTESYLEGVSVLPPMVASLYMHVLYDVFSSVSFFVKKSVNIMLATIAAAAANIIMNYYAINRFGYISAAYTTLFSYCILVILHYISSFLIEKKDMFGIKFILITSIVTITICLLSNLLFKLKLIRYFLVFAFASIIIIKKDFFLSFFDITK